MNTAYQTAQSARKEDDGRLAALQGVKAGLSGYQAMQAAEAGGGADASNIGQFVGISLSLGAQKSSSQQVHEQNVSQGSNVTAGNNLTIRATGAEGDGGDILVKGSALQASNDLSLSAARDIQLLAVQNTQQLKGSNQSSGGAVGVSLGYSTQGSAGLSIFANANKGSGSEKGNGTTWTETTLDAGGKVNLASGQDTVLRGAQVSGEQIVADVGRDLRLQSLQDSDRYNSKQTDVSGGVSFTYGTMNGSASVSVSQSKLKSDFNSVQEQTGLFAGKGGYQLDVQGHTQLDGSVIASTAAPEANRLETDTLGWTDIRNKAEFSAQQQSAGFSTGGAIGQQFAGNMANTLLVGANRSESESSTTYSAVSDGAIVIRNQAEQQQDVANLSRDVEHANNALSPIFDKEKEQRRLREIQLIGEIGNQTMDIIRTHGQIEATKAAREALAKEGNFSPSAEEIAGSDAYKKKMGEYGTGSDLQRAAQAVTAALQGLAGGNVAGAIGGAAAPYLAQTIKQVAGENEAARLMAHAVLGAVVAQAQGNSAAAGGLGALTAEVAADLIAKQLYEVTDVSKLTEEQKQTVSALATLAGGLAGAVGGSGAADAVAGAQGGKNAVENNYLTREQLTQAAKELRGCTTAKCRSDIVEKYGQTSLEQDLLAIEECMANPGNCAKHSRAAAQAMVSLEEAYEALGDGSYQDWLAIKSTNFLFQETLASVTAGHSADALVAALQQKWSLTDEQSDAIRAGLAMVLAGGASVVGGKALISKAIGPKATGKDYVDILSPEAKKHILYGDKPGSGGHMWPGQPGKTVFPQSWSADKIVHEVGDIATSPNTKWYAQTGTGGIYTSKGDPAKWVAYEVRDGVRMRVVYQPATGKVITAFPDNAPIPPYKPIK
ncbi:hemagglutinin repeat-containing protein [Stutzerimonas nosocomialis]|uniref:hemagglutinin repeat-containing protein n=1 Tax=Stutzerimonas nosocomialis TaxID=1056496 RepID=UPI0032E50B26